MGKTSTAAKRASSPVRASSNRTTFDRHPSSDDMARAAGQVAKATSRAARAAGLGRPLMAPSTVMTTERNNIDFKKMIGGPLQAAVDAQVASSLATIDFINKVGFTEATNGGDRELVMVDFTHTRKDVDAEGQEVSKEISSRCRCSRCCLSHRAH